MLRVGCARGVRSSSARRTRTPVAIWPITHRPGPPGRTVLDARVLYEMFLAHETTLILGSYRR
jgi:hypothetical protein